MIFHLPVSYATGHPTITVADMNGDSKNDIIVTLVEKDSSTRLYVVYNHGEGKYSLDLPK